MPKQNKLKATRSNAAAIILVFFALVILGAVVFAYFASGGSDNTGVSEETVGTAEELKEGQEESDEAKQGDFRDWNTYESERYSFKLLYPSEWEVAETTVEEEQEGQVPMVTVYAATPLETTVEAPFDFHVDAVPYVSIYPTGVPTDGLRGELRDSSLASLPLYRDARDYLLEDGTVFATMALPDNLPISWSEAGFIFARVPVVGERVFCLRGGVEIADEECDPFAGDSIVREGTVDAALRTQEEQILASFRLVPPDDEELIRVDKPETRAIVESPLTVKGEARGYWFFEASFPAQIIDANGTVLAEVPIEAIDDWMTEEFVSFEALIPFDSPGTAGGYLILNRANPSDLPQNNDSLAIPISFGTGGGL